MSLYKELIEFERKKRLEEKRDADSLAKKPKIATEKAISRNVKQDRIKLTESISDIMERCGCVGFYSEDDVRKRLQNISSLLNKPK